MLLRYFPTGILGLGLSRRCWRSFMSGMAGNVSWPSITASGPATPTQGGDPAGGATDRHYLNMGRWGHSRGHHTFHGCGAYIGDALQQHHGYVATCLLLPVNAPLFADPSCWVKVLKAHHRQRRAFVGARERHWLRCRHSPRTHDAGECKSVRIHRRLDHASASLSQRYGDELLRGYLGLLSQLHRCCPR